MSIGHTSIILSLSKQSIKGNIWFYKSCSVYLSCSVRYAIWEYGIKVKVELSFGHKPVILSLSELNIESKNLFYKSCSIWYAIWECDIESKSLTVIWSDTSHFITFWTKHQIRKFLLPKLTSLVCFLRMSHNKNFHFIK